MSILCYSPSMELHKVLQISSICTSVNIKLFILNGEIFSLMVMLDQEEYLLAKAYSQE